MTGANLLKYSPLLQIQFRIRRSRRNGGTRQPTTNGRAAETSRPSEWSFPILKIYDNAAKSKVYSGPPKVYPTEAPTRNTLLELKYPLSVRLLLFWIW